MGLRQYFRDEGNLVLENLPLKKANLDHLGLPLAIRNGFLGKANIQIPVRRFRSEPWILSFEQLYIILGPRLSSEFDADTSQESQTGQKLAELERIELKWKLSNEPNSQYNSSYSSWVSYGTNLVTGIIENLQIVIKDVHIRYEDSESIPGVQFAFGATIQKLSAQTCNESWEPEFVSSTGDHSFKLLEIDKISFYWDTNAEMHGQKSHGDLATAMLNPFTQSSHDYIVSPVSGVAKLKRNQSESPLRSLQSPRITCDLTMDVFSVSLNEVQYSQIVKCLRSLRQLDRKRRQLPGSSVGHVTTAHDRWQYAIKAVLNPIRERYKYRNWPAALKRATDCRTYVEIYEKHLKDPAGLSAEERAEKDRIEAEFGLEELKALREITMSFADEDRLLDTSAGPSLFQNTLQRLFPAWSGWYYGAENRAEPETIQTQELLNTLKDTYENDNMLKRDTVLGLFSFVLRKGLVKLVSASEKKSVIEVQFEDLLLKTESRPRFGSYRAELALGSLYLIDPASEVPLIRPQTREKDTGSVPGDRILFSVIFEKKPFYSTLDYRLHLTSKGLECSYKQSLPKILTDFFMITHEEVKKLGPESFDAVRELTQRELESIRDSIEHKKWDIQVDIVAPQLIISENDTPGSQLLLIDFGRLKATNFAMPPIPPMEDADDDDDIFITPRSTPECTPPLVRDDTLAVELTDVQVLVCKGKDTWRSHRTKANSPWHVVDRFSIFFRIERSVSCDDCTTSLFSVKGSLPKLVFHLSEQKVQTVLNMVKLVRMKGLPQGGRSPSQCTTPVLRNPDLRLVVAHFNVEKVLIHIQFESVLVAELQVTGMQVDFTKRPYDTFTSLTVHSLLVVDAMQVFGPDYELLVASHRQVYIDSYSGSIRDSEPCSPVSPASPDFSKGGCRATSPISLTRALSKLHDGDFQRGYNSSSPILLDPGHIPLSRVNSGPLSCEEFDSQALISFEYMQISSDCPTNDLKEEIRIANLQFSNLDIIANQDTIFQIVAFLSSILPSNSREPPKPTGADTPSEGLLPTSSKFKLTFDFRRLNMLLMHSVYVHGCDVGRKVGTITVFGAQIRAELGELCEVEGSLGGLQVLDLTPEGRVHQRVVHMGIDPLAESQILGASLYLPTGDDHRAFTFLFRKTSSEMSLSVHLASVIYIHSPAFLEEVTLCAGQLRRHMTFFARNLKKAAANVAYDLAQRGTEALSEFARSQRAGRSRTVSLALSDIEAERLTTEKIAVSLSVTLETPIVVLPRSSHSTEVLVAQLGKITLRNAKYKNNDCEGGTSFGMRRSSTIVELSSESKNDRLHLEVKNMNVYSLDLVTRLGHARSSTATDFYRCNQEKQKIVEDATVELVVQRCHAMSASDGLDFSPSSNSSDSRKIVNFSGGFTTPLRVGLTRSQYRQIMDTLAYMSASSESSSASRVSTGTLGSSPPQKLEEQRPKLAVNGDFVLSLLTVDIISDGMPISRLLCNDIVLECDKAGYETELKFSVSTITMEDLTLPEDSKHRYLFRSSFLESGSHDLPTFLSTSCPELRFFSKYMRHSSSLPDKLQNQCFAQMSKKPAQRTSKSPKEDRPYTPPPSPLCEARSKSNLVTITVQMIDPKHPEFTNRFTSIRTFKEVQFSSCDIVVNLNSWVLIFDFFSSSSEPTPRPPSLTKADSLGAIHSSDTKIEIRSLNLLLNRDSREVARVKISGLSLNQVSRFDDMDITGKLEKVAVYDLTPQGRLYREKFLTSGSEALDFQFYKFSHASAVQQSYDARLKLRMSSVTIVHVHRFFNELMAFNGEFARLRDLVESSRSGPVDARTGMRLLLDISTGSPVIVFPVSSLSDEVIMADLGGMTVVNQFVYSNEREGNESLIPMLKQYVSRSVRTVPSFDGGLHTPVLLDTLEINLKNMLTYPAKRQEIGTSQNPDLCLESVEFVRDGMPYLQQPCHLRLVVERNLEIHLSRHVPNLSVQGSLTEVHASVDSEQYKRIKGFLMHNLGEPYVDEGRGSVASSTESLGTKEKSGDKFVTVFVRLDLVCVTLDLLSPDRKKKFGRILFTRSYLLTEIHNDGSTDIDLFSRKISMHDTRYDDAPRNAKTNVFGTILDSFVEKESSKNLQVEVHYRSCPKKTELTVVLNRMRVMAIMDWWIVFLDFITQPISNPHFREGNQSQLSQSVPRSAGVVVRAELASNIPFLLKLNVTDSETVVVEDSSLLDTIAVILRGTAVVKYWPNLESEKLNCDISSLQIYSCILADEQQTSLSIVDPFNLSLAIKATQPSFPSGLIAATESPPPSKLEIILSTYLYVRLSYGDMKVFLRMFESLPKQARRAAAEKRIIGTIPVNMQEPVLKLVDMGFNPDECYTALKQCKGSVELAASWLCEQKPSCVVETEDFSFFQSVELKAPCISLILIDDTRDADIPLLDVSLLDVISNQSLSLSTGMSAKFKLNIDYYNRAFSGWEPFLETWEATVSLKEVRKENGSFLKYEIRSEAALDLNITSDFLQLHGALKESWVEGRKSECSTAFKRRSPFVPYAIHNATGSGLAFATNVLMSDAMNLVKKPTQLIKVDVGETRGFSFEGRDRARLRDNRRVSAVSNQLFIEVDGWKMVGPVSVDKVGLFYRHMHHPASGRAARLIIEVSLEGSARKLITIRSSLVVTNGLHDTVEIKMDSVTGSVKIKVPPSTTYPVPLDLVWSNIWVRPLGDKAPPPYLYSTQPVNWSEVHKINEVRENTIHCVSTTSNADPSYRIFVRVRKEEFPEPPALPRVLSTSSLSSLDCIKAALPIHTVSLLPPLIIINLLPVDLGWRIQSSAEGRIRSGKEASVHTVDLFNEIEVNFALENFVLKRALLVSQDGVDVVKRLCFCDNKSRRLFLQAKISTSSQAAIKITVFAPYWIINNSGLPLIFRQEGCEHDAAGQEEEHERAQCRMPLMFSFTDSDASVNLIVRLGNQLHPNARTEWCNNLPLNENVRVRRLMARPNENRPDYIYLVGVTVRPGKGRYRDSLIVKIAPRFEIHNFSKNRLMVGQKSLVRQPGIVEDQSNHLVVMPESSVIFHWPRLDKEQLLCVKMADLGESRWSGGFQIEQIQSCHISTSDSEGTTHFLHIEVSIQGPTYCVVFTDGDTMPPFYRIDNWSEVPISFYQTGTSESTRAVVKAKSSLAYAWAEPVLPHYLTCEAPGGSSASFYLDKFGELQRTLEYENFIYIAFSSTFPRDLSPTMPSRTTPDQPQLVLEVTSGSNKVKLAPKKYGERSQFWRLTSASKLEHEGSVPPSDPKKKMPRKGDALVLDIEAPAIQPSQFTNLVVRKADPRRSNTQTWQLQDGKLLCQYLNLYVQSKDGVDHLRPWADAVIGPTQPITRYYKPNLPAEQAIEYQKYRPGSGFLVLRISADGPTRVLEITDMHAPTGMMEYKAKPVPKPILGKDLQIEFSLVGGIGIDLISGGPREELIYCKNIMPRANPTNHVTEIRSYYAPERGYALGETLCVMGKKSVSKSHFVFKLGGISGEVFVGSENRINFQVEDVQVDNMLQDPETPLVLSVNKKEHQSTGSHAIKFSAMHIPCPNVNANIFKDVCLTMKSLSLNVEEQLLFRLLLFFGFDQSDLELERCEENDLDRTRAKLSAAGVQLIRHYVSSIRVDLNELRLSYLTASRLPPRLSRLKRQMGFKLLTRFENAELQFAVFEREHVFETKSFLLDSIQKHYIEEIMSQAVKIFGSYDIIGAPLGFVQDFQEGVANLVVDGDVEGLFRNLAHGLSNSTAKVTGSLSENLGALTMDAHFEEERRRRLRSGFSYSSSDRLLAGWEGFKHGVYGGMTSIVQQTYEGAVTEGFVGVFAGLGRGLIGTVAKPTIGMLDFAAGAAAAIRNSSRSDSHGTPNPHRLRRLLRGPGGILPRYKQGQALGQKILHELAGTQDETFLSFMPINNDKNPMHLMLSDRCLRIFSISEIGTRTVLKQVELRLIRHVIHSGRNTVDIVEIPHQSTSSKESIFTINCPEEVAKEVTREINYAKNIYEENRHELMRVSRRTGKHES